MTTMQPESVGEINFAIAAAAGVSFVLTAVAVMLCIKVFLENRRIKNRFSGVLDLESQKIKLAEEAARLSSDYCKAKAMFDRLTSSVALLEENLEEISFGVYRPHFSFNSSEEYKARLEDQRTIRKQLIKDGKAAHCSVNWSVGGSNKDGQRMTKQYTKLLLRAFNGETEAAIARVAWNNATKMEERIRKAHEAINELGSMMHMSITKDYLNACLDELRLEHEYELKKQSELEEQREIRARAKEEEKAQREFERAQRDAEQDELRYQKSLENARSEISSATGKDLADLTSKIALLEERLKEAEAKKQRAISMAQQTRCGYLYVISNHGSLGEEVLKIGMTRRLDPMDRVRELGDASVPFGFDVHAIVYCEDAPSLECEIHKHFADHRVNRVNLRREFFKVPLSDVEAFIRRKGLQIELTSHAEAKEYRESLALLKSIELISDDQEKPPLFPDSPFARSTSIESETIV
ncbi:MAG: DUF4041 domain-containing protein [Bdellovibrionota bacterium]